MTETPAGGGRGGWTSSSACDARGEVAAANIDPQGKGEVILSRSLTVQKIDLRTSRDLPPTPQRHLTARRARRLDTKILTHMSQISYSHVIQA